MAFDTSKVTNTYPNPLDDFISHSHHFVLTVSDTTKAFEAMIGDANQTSYLDKVLSAKHPGAMFNPGNDSKAWVLIDTRRFSAFHITSVSMEHVFGTGPANNPTSPSNTTNIQVTDSTGMTFFNMLVDLFKNKIQSSRSSCFFMLSIMFVGHKRDGTTETISTCNIPLILLTMEFEVTHRGSIYEMVMMETEGAMSQGPMENINSLIQVQSIKSEPKLGMMLQELEDQLNKKSAAYFRDFTNDLHQKAIVAAINSGEGVPKMSAVGKLVQYMITIPEDWAGFECTLAARESHAELMHEAAERQEITKEEAEKRIEAARQSGVKVDGTNSQISFGTVTTIPDAIKIILESSVEFLELSSEEKRLKGQAIGYKCMAGITSDEKTYLIHFDICPFVYPKSPDKKTKAANKSNESEIQPATSNAVDNVEPIRNLITYDYMFSGKNTAVLDLKIKYAPESVIALDTTVDIGANRFKTNAEHGQKKTDAKSAADDGSKTPTNSFAPQIRTSDPIFVAQQSKDQQQNTGNQHTESTTKDEAIAATKAKQEYTQTTAYMHFISSLKLDMVVRGNPNIIIKYADRSNSTGPQPHTLNVNDATITQVLTSADDDGGFGALLKSPISSAKQSYYKKYMEGRINQVKNSTSGGGDPLLSGPHVSMHPVFCKINMFAPNIDYATSDFADGKDMYTNEFFYNGPYMVLTMNTRFDMSTFTHDFAMIPYDASGSGDVMGSQ